MSRAPNGDTKPPRGDKPHGSSAHSRDSFTSSAGLSPRDVKNAIHIYNSNPRVSHGPSHDLSFSPRSAPDRSRCRHAVARCRGSAVDVPAFDLLIRNGRIVDGSGNPWFHGDVAITGGRIVAVGRCRCGRPSARSTPRGSSSPRASSTCTRIPITLLLEDGRAQSKIRQGVTTEVLGEGNRRVRPRARCRRAGRDDRGKPFAWTTLGGYFETHRSKPGVRQHRLLCRHRQRLAMRDGQVVRPAHRRPVGAK